MRQRYSIILWRKAEKKDKSFEEIARRAYEVLNIFQDYPKELRPNYLTARSPKEVKEFVWEFQNFKALLKKGINKEGCTVFEELGYSASFFSSMSEEESSSFSIIAGNKCEKFYNSIIIDLPLILNIYDMETAETIVGLFEKLVRVYKPFWGCISDKVLARKYGRYLEGNLPVTIHWLNYWSQDIMSTVGVEKIQKVVEQNPQLSFKDGILLIRKTALDVSKEEDMSFHNKIHDQIFSYHGEVFDIGNSTGNFSI